jgi:hypothetical protein
VSVALCCRVSVGQNGIIESSRVSRRQPAGRDMSLEAEELNGVESSRVDHNLGADCSDFIITAEATCSYHCDLKD